MNDKQLGDALVKLDAADLASVPAAHKQTWEILQQDHRRVRWWTILTILAWLPAAGLSLLVVVMLGFLCPLDAKLYQLTHGERDVDGRPIRAVRDTSGHEEHAEPAAHDSGYAHRAHVDIQELERTVDLGFKKMTVLTAMALLALSFAMLASFALIFATRRATLRQINASLLVIADQLKQRA